MLRGVLDRAPSVFRDSAGPCVVPVFVEGEGSSTVARYSIHGLMCYVRGRCFALLGGFLKHSQTVRCVDNLGLYFDASYLNAFQASWVVQPQSQQTRLGVQHLRFDRGKHYLALGD